MIILAGFYVGIAADGADAVLLTRGDTALVGLGNEELMTSGTVFVMLTAVP